MEAEGEASHAHGLHDDLHDALLPACELVLALPPALPRPRAVVCGRAAALCSLAPRQLLG